MATTTLPRPDTLSPADGGGRLPLLPSLDGLRGLAVVAVLLYHAEVRRLPGGFLGVESFFVVSGYLITSLLWTEAVTTGRLRALRFWARRARRLLPALGASVTFTTVGLVAFYPTMVARVRGDLVAAAAYVSNWYLIFTKQSYFENFDRQSPFRHLWSLAVEEQFYLVFPLLFGLLLFLVGRRPRRLAAVTGVLAAVSAVEMWALYVPAKDPSRVYYGTDTRASGLLIGVTLALLWRPWEQHDRSRSRLGGPLGHDLFALAGLVMLAVAGLGFAETDDLVYRGGIQLVALATALVILGTTADGGVVRRLLSGRSITAVGRRSYSLYLWHWPVYVVTRPGLDLPWSSGPILVVRLVLTVALAELSYRVVERPVRDGAIGRLRRRFRYVFAISAPARRARLRRRWTTIATVSTTSALVVVLLVVQATPAPPLASVLSSEANLVATGVLPAQPEPGPLAPGQAQPLDVAAPAPVAPAGGAAAPTAVPVPAGPPKTVFALGDSVMLGAAGALSRTLPGVTVNAVVGRQLSEGVDIVRGLAAQGALPQVLLVHLGNNGDVRASQFDDLLAAAGPAIVVLVTVKVERRWEGPNNDVIRSFANRPNVRIADWKNIVSGCPGAVFFPDGTHLRADGQVCYANHVASLVLAP